MISQSREFAWTLAVLAFTTAPYVFGQSKTQRPPSPSQPSPAAADVRAILDGEARTSRATSISAREAKAMDTDLQGLLENAVQTARELKKVDEKWEELKPQISDWKRRLDQHNANPCTYPEDHPEVCAGYDQEARVLNAERDRLRAAAAEIDDQKRTLKSRLGILKARIRIAAALVYQCRCDGLTPEEAKACWDRCFDNADPRLKSCLDIDDLDSFASCLLRSGR